MTTDYRALCAELLNALEIQLDELASTNRLCKRARAALAQPEPVGPTDDELVALAEELDDLPVLAPFAFARAVLARWGHPALAPIPVSERLPVAEDCDGEGRCWVLGKVESDWRLINAANPGVPHLRYCFSHWLPFHALPLPGQPAPAAPAP